jgi:hypothetical protein
MTLDLPPAKTPLYNHPLPQIESWLTQRGCERDPQALHRWTIQQGDWQAELELDIEQLTVRYLKAGVDGQDILRSFKYSLSRQDIENAIFAGP